MPRDLYHLEGQQLRLLLRTLENAARFVGRPLDRPFQRAVRGEIDDAITNIKFTLERGPDSHDEAD